jgi:hypothetical protein
VVLDRNHGGIPEWYGTLPALPSTVAQRSSGLGSRNFRKWEPLPDTLKHAFVRALFAVLGRLVNPPLEPPLGLSLDELGL